jgi:hypothetical protein
MTARRRRVRGKEPLVVRGEPAADGLSAEPSEAYKAVRAHELMLNQATAAFEHAVLAPLVLLNGGAIVAYLTLLGTLADNRPGLTVAQWLLSAAAVLGWAVGLRAAVTAARHGFLSQRNFSIAHRLRREELEKVLFPPTMTVILTAGSGKSRENLEKEAVDERTKFEEDWQKSVTIFIAGAVIALIAILIGAA